MDETQEYPLFARCSVGKNKWFWITYRKFEDCCERVVDDSGYATSAIEAEQQARASITARFGQVIPDQLQTYFASGVYRRRKIKERATRTCSTANVNQPEFVYSDYESDYDGAWHSIQHRIVKKTAKRVYVARYPVNSCNEDDKWEEDGQVFHDVKTIVLDRQELESDEGAWSHRRRHFFYSTPCEARRRSSRPRCFEVLGLEAGVTRDAIAKAYRTLAKKMHPDHGGSESDFKELQMAYETAMACVAA